jgi:hypothetical protein
MPARYAEARNKVFHSRDTAAPYSSHENDNYQRSFQSAEQAMVNEEIRDQSNFF